MANFVTGFHNLEGDLVNERKKSFFKLLKTTSLNSSESEIDNALKNIQPKTYQERLFWVETLIFFKKTEALLEILKEGNIEHIKIIIRQKWFIEEAFKNTSPVEFVNDFLPCVSYSTRLKILRKISCCWSEDKMDQLFDAIQKRYGIFNALNVIHSCSFSKIVNIFEASENEIKLNGYQIQQIFHKHQKFFIIYINYMFDFNKEPFADTNILNLIALKNPELYIELLTLNKIKPVKLTKAASVKVTPVAKNVMFQDPQKFINILSKRAIVKILGSDFRFFYQQIFPTKSENWSSEMPDIINILKYFPKKIRWELFTEVFNNNFPDKSLDDLFIHVDILKLNPSPEMKMRWAEVKVATLNDENYLQYYTTSVGIPLLKEKINLCSDMIRRQTLLKLLITICAENKDMDALSSILEYIASRHKNENPYTYKRILEHVCTTFKDDELSKEHWNFIRQQIELLRTGGTVQFYDYKSIMDKLVVYSYKKDKELFRLVATEYVQDVIRQYYSFRLDLDESEVELEIFYEFCKVIPSYIQADEPNFNLLKSGMITEFYDICHKCPEKCLNILEFPYLVSIIKEVCNMKKIEHFELSILIAAIKYHFEFPQYSLPFLNETKIIELLSHLSNENYFVGDLIIYFTEKNSISAEEENILKILNTMDVDIDRWTMSDIVTSMLKLKPKLFATYFEKIYKKSEEIYFDKIIKNYSHLNLNKKICEYFNNEWCNFNYNKQETALEAAIQFLSEEEFLNFVNTNLYNKIVEESDHDHGRIELENKILQLSKNITKPISLIKLFINISSESNLQYCVSSLYRLFAKTPEKLLSPLLKLLLEKEPTISKHFIHLSCAFLDYDTIINLFNSNGSKKYLCLAAIKYFKNNPTEHLFTIVTKLLTEIDNCDQIFFKKLVRIIIPKKYRSRYVEICWNLLESYDNKIKCKSYYDKLLHQTFNEDVITSLSSSFINNVFIQYFSLQDKNRLHQVDKFIVLCLTYREQERSDYLNQIMKILPKLSKPTFRNFFNILFDFVRDEKPKYNIVNLFLENWNKFILITDALDEYIRLNILNAYSNNSAEGFAKSILNYLEQLITEFGPQIYEIFKNNLALHISTLDKYEQYKLFDFILNLNSSPTICVLVIQLMTPVSLKNNRNLKILYDNIVTILQKSKDTIVKVNYEIYLNLEIV